MSIADIESKAARQNLVFDTAKKIRALLDEASKQLPDDDGDVETEIIDLVTEE